MRKRSKMNDRQWKGEDLPLSFGNQLCCEGFRKFRGPWEDEGLERVGSGSYRWELKFSHQPSRKTENCFLCPKSFCLKRNPVFSLPQILLTGQHCPPAGQPDSFPFQLCRVPVLPRPMTNMVLVVKNLLVNAGDIREAGSVPGSKRSPVGGHGNTLQYSCLENPHGQRSLAGYSP